jgi:putative spermidine/putrescine transport system permease protein
MVEQGIQGVMRRSAVGLLPACTVVAVFLLLPLLLLFRYSLNRFVPGEFMVDALTVENYAKFITDPYYRGVLQTTLAMSAAVTIACLLLGFPLATLVARMGARWKPAMVLLIILPLFVGNAVRAAGWMVVLGQKGALSTLLDAVGLPPAVLMYSPSAVFIGIVSVNLPFAVLTLQSVLERLDPALREAALGLGASPVAAFRLVTLPLARAGVIVAATLCFILSMNAYATPILIGGPRFQMMAPQVATQVLDQSNWPFGAAVAFVLIAVTLALTAATGAVFGGERHDKRDEPFNRTG